eukprot:6209527-Pleurochrysis_carterae.AAC.2
MDGSSVSRCDWLQLAVGQVPEIAGRLAAVPCCPRCVYASRSNQNEYGRGLTSTNLAVHDPAHCALYPCQA